MHPAFRRLKFPCRPRCVNVTSRRAGLRMRVVPALLLAWLLVLPNLARAADNSGLGPFSVRNQFPLSLPYLSFLPESPGTLAAGGVRAAYQYAIANTFINTQSPERNNTQVIDEATVAGGLTAANFPAQGYGAYLDVETVRHQLLLRYGLWDSVELGLDLAWVTFGGGGLDSMIESVETSVHAFNKDRSHAARDRFGLYFSRDGRLLVGTSEPATALPQDPVLNLKWNWGEGGEVLPLVSLKLSYKVPLESDPSQPRNLVSSGRADYGYALLAAKQIGSVVAHLQVGHNHLEVDGNDTSTDLEFKLFGLEFRAAEHHSWLVQIMSQSSLFRSADFNARPGDFLLSRPTDVLTTGYRFQGSSVGFDLGFVEDLNQNQNETDIILFTELSWQW